MQKTAPNSEQNNQKNSQQNNQQKSNLIGIYPNALTPEFCQKSIDMFEKNRNKKAGVTGQGIDKQKKNSLDLTITNHSQEWGTMIDKISLTLVEHLVDYVRKHPFLLSGAVSLVRHDPKSNRQIPITHEDVMAMSDIEISNYMGQLYNFGSINLQKYLKGEGGYFHWHSEVFPSPHDPAQTSLHRVLLWMYYLNDVAEGGETDFYYQNESIKPKQGTLVIAPASFTHTHRGNMPISNDKYIYTSWVQYHSAQDMYGRG